jgi:hypothetical protein
MTRDQLEHIIRAAGVLADVSDLIVIGSQAILGEFPSAPAELLLSNEADVYPSCHPEPSDLIDSTIGEGSPFQKSFGYYARGVGETSAILPRGWRDRLILVTGENTRFVRGWCLEAHDLPIAKYVAEREKDRDFTRALARYRMVQRDLLKQRLADTELHPEVRALVEKRMQSDFAAAVAPQ